MDAFSFCDALPALLRKLRRSKRFVCIARLWKTHATVARTPSVARSVSGGQDFVAPTLVVVRELLVALSPRIPNQKRRAAAAVALGKLAEPSARPALAITLRDPCEEAAAPQGRGTPRPFACDPPGAMITEPRPNSAGGRVSLDAWQYP